MHKPRKLALAVLASITIAGIAGASAASLGTLDSESIGSGDTLVASCDTDGMTITYATGYDAANNKTTVTAVELAGVSALCNGLDATLRLTDGAASNPATLATVNDPTLAVVAGEATLTLTTPVDAELVNALSLVIQG